MNQLFWCSADLFCLPSAALIPSPVAEKAPSVKKNKNEYRVRVLFTAQFRGKFQSHISLCLASRCDSECAWIDVASDDTKRYKFHDSSHVYHRDASELMTDKRRDCAVAQQLGGGWGWNGTAPVVAWTFSLGMHTLWVCSHAFMCSASD